ncbi:SDR family NAD(P)-dependent oxidoreductase, partial [uncultured Sphingomonas sp.]|uniref:SDR family NAD(P)-dependent oxidoreductase n=1 Tax=uncultured Sphingomonas sp. TaxID=158754 RepID=UPI0035CBDCC1
MSLAGRRVLVTGGAAGIGAAIVRALAAAGAEVTVADIDAEGAQTVADEIGGTAMTLDVSDPAAVAIALGAQAPFAILVNNAGVDQHAFFTATTPAQWQRL